MPLKRVLFTGLAAGLIAAVAAAVFHMLLSEPLIDLAVAAEVMEHGAAGGTVSREVQKIGLLVALLTYGLIWALLAAAAVHLLRLQSGREALLLVLALGVGVAIFPFLKYPANPPGVGDPESIQTRQLIYMIALAVGGFGAIACHAIARMKGARLGVACYVALLVAAYISLPASPDPVASTPELSAFRATTFLGLLLFWSVFSSVFARLLARALSFHPPSP